MYMNSVFYSGGCGIDRCIKIKVFLTTNEVMTLPIRTQAESTDETLSQEELYRAMTKLSP